MRTTVAVIAALTAVAAAGAAGHSGTAPADPRLQLVASARHVFTLTGVPVSGLYPGAVRTLSVRVRNPAASAISVTSITARVAAATNRSGCAGTAANLVVTGSRKRIRIAGRRTATAALRVSMPKTVANACQGATFRITLAGRGSGG